MLFISEEAKEAVLNFQKEQLKYYDFISFQYNINIKMAQYNTVNVKLSN